MKLYATTTSERATKGQGGNKYLIIKIQAGDDRKELAELHIRQNDNKDGYGLYLYHGGTEEQELIKEIKTKGKKQKGEPCKCGAKDCKNPF